MAHVISDQDLDLLKGNLSDVAMVARLIGDRWPALAPLLRSIALTMRQVIVRVDGAPLATVDDRSAVRHAIADYLISRLAGREVSG